MDEEFYRRQRELMARVVAESDAVIATAAVPGKKAPVLVTAEMVAKWPGFGDCRSGRRAGGNCELTRPDQQVVEHGVTIFGPINVPAGAPQHASQMYARTSPLSC